MSRRYKPSKKRAWSFPRVSGDEPLQEALEKNGA